MKLTKNMFYNPTNDSRELELYAENDGRLYDSMIKPVIDCLTKKEVKGIYSSEKAIPCFYRIATEAAKSYAKEFGGLFSVTDRYTVAVELEKYYKEIIDFEADRVKKEAC